jgi:hypothetical protein
MMGTTTRVSEKCSLLRTVVASGPLGLRMTRLSSARTGEVGLQTLPQLTARLAGGLAVPRAHRLVLDHRRTTFLNATQIAVVGFLLVPGFPLMSYASAVEPLRAANQISGRELYRWWNTAPADIASCASNGTAILPSFEFGSMDNQPDLMLVCAGETRRLFTIQRPLRGSAG